MYKVEAYIGECLESILSQDCDGIELEIIAVDDGSPDRCGDIARKYSEKDGRLKVIRQENLGPGGARNTGLDLARGEYVVFVDADDYLAPGAIREVVDKIKESRPEAVQLCGADITEDGPLKLFSMERWEKGHHTGMEIFRAEGFHVVVMYTVYRRDFIEKHKLRFLPYLYHEDNEFTPRVFYYLKDVVSIDKVLYYKRVNYDSITRTVNTKKNYDLVEVSRSLRKFAKSVDDPEDRKFMMRIAANAFKLAMTNETPLMEASVRKTFNKHLKKNKELLESFFETDRFRYKIEGFLLRLFSSNMTGVNNRLFHNTLLRKYKGWTSF